MQLLEMSDISVVFGGRELFAFDRFELWTGDKIGLIGANGSGKTTFLRLISKELKPVQGKIKSRGNWKIFHQFSEESSLFQNDGHQVEGEALSRWDLKEIADRKVDTYSGGEKTRIRLAEVFTSPTDLLLFDEPTANLDREGMEQLQELLNNLESFILISHDRELLDQVTNRTLDIIEGKIIDFPGKYSEYMEWKEQEYKRKEKEYRDYIHEKNRLVKIASNQRNRAKKMTKKPKNISSSDAKQREFGAVGRSYGGKEKSLLASAKHTEKRIEQLEKKEKPKKQFIIRPDFSLTDAPKNKIIIEGKDLSFGYEGQDLIFEKANFRLKGNRRTVLLGPNGCGKTTLFRLIEEGHPGIRIVPKAKIGILRQALDQIDPEKNILENIHHTSIQKEEVNRNVLARMGFAEKDLFKKASVLSGGEKIKLTFAMLFVADFNMILMDEPTNYLDLPSIEAIEQLFLEYEGTMLFTSHDRQFVEHLAEEVWTIDEGKIYNHHGTFPWQKEEHNASNDEKIVLELRKSQLIGELSLGLRSEEEVMEELKTIEEALRKIPPFKK
ncbi:MAG: ABC-F family ATP-binding cassette domain-containing protein [Tissierellia bacterium]|nr:ABC-F family ATP-binding cassette domain-containing protein [Tissierellia bacterium]